MDSIKKFKNGLTLIVSEGGALSSSFAIMIGAGSINENEKNNGISHYIEHMNFKGTKNYSSYDISNIMDYNGANYNAYTSTETTCFHAQTIKDNLENTFKVMSEIVFSSIYDDEEAKREKDVIIEEINMSEDSPEDVCFDLGSLAFFGNDGYGRTILGTSSNVSSFTKKDILNYLNDNYVAENIVITFAGNVTKSECEKLVEKYVMPIIKEGKPKEIPYHNVKNQRQFLAKNKDIEQVHFCLKFPSLAYVNDDRIKSEMALSILGGSMSSRLFRKVREELGLAYSVYSYASRYKDVGVANIYTALNSEKVDLGYNAVLETIDDLVKNGVTEEEFNKVKNGIKASTVFSLEKPTSKVQLFSRYYLMTGELYNYEERIKAVDNITKKDVEEAVKELNKYDMASAIVGRNVKPLKI
ncbi:MAG: insulinase family protein [Clostridia bacterium]|nr:insulinase family protein [Clostridia bacterium]